MRGRQFFHGLPAGASGMKHQAVVIVFKQFGDRLHARRGDAEHGQAYGGFDGVGTPVGMRHHAGDGMRCIR